MGSFKNMWKQLQQALFGRGVTPAMLTALLALNDKSWIDEIVAVLKKHSATNGEQPIVDTMQIESNHEVARAIMGTNFLGLAEIEKAYGVKYTPAMRAKMKIIPDELMKVLVTCAETHILVAGFQLSIDDINQKTTNVMYFSPSSDGPFERKHFARIAVGLRWFLLRKEVIQNSKMKTYGEQKGIIPLGEELPYAREVVFGGVALFLTTGERLFERLTFVRCKDVSYKSCRVCVSADNYQGKLCISGFHDRRRDEILGACSILNS